MEKEVDTVFTELVGKTIKEMEIQSGPLLGGADRIKITCNNNSIYVFYVNCCSEIGFKKIIKKEKKCQKKD